MPIKDSDRKMDCRITELGCPQAKPSADDIEPKVVPVILETLKRALNFPSCLSGSSPQIIP